MSDDLNGKTQTSLDDKTDPVPCGPALLTNRAWITWSSTIVRLTFAEQDGPDNSPAYRTAVVMTRSDAEALSKLLIDSLLGESADGR